MAADLDLRQLRAFAAVCDTGSVSSAARKAHLTQPALSRRISELESALGVMLFDRAGGRLRLTNEGESLLKHSREVLAGADSLVTHAEALGKGHGRVLWVGTSSMTLESVIAPVLDHYLPAHKNIEVRLVEGGGPALLEKVERGELHLAVTVPLNPRLQTRQLFSMRTLAVIPAGIAKRGKTVRLEDLIDQPLLMLRRGFVHRNAFDATCELMQIQPDIVYESAIPQTLLALARIGFGVAVLPSVQHVDEAGLKAQVIVCQGYSMGSWMAVNWDPRRFVPDYMQRFIEALVEQARIHSPDRRYHLTPPLLSRHVMP